MLHTTLAPIALASTTHQDRDTTLYSFKESVEMFDGMGRRTQQLHGNDFSIRIMRRASELRLLNEDKISELRTSYANFAKISKRGTASVALSLQVLDALAGLTPKKWTRN
jgi:hypothetical protein